MEFPPPSTDRFVEFWPGVGTPEVSILMPIFQQRLFVREAMSSILAQQDVVAEIIVSDDASWDQTFAVAQDEVVSWLKQHGSKHRIIMRQGLERLRRDHLPLLVEASSSDIVFQAHGDLIHKEHRSW